MPEGRNRLKGGEFESSFASNNQKRALTALCDLYKATDLLKQMAEALEDMTKNPYEPIGFDGSQALKKFKEWK